VIALLGDHQVTENAQHVISSMKDPPGLWNGVEAEKRSTTMKTKLNIDPAEQSA
jgi:hypothetical protein